ncbi:hypothetical protein F8388_010073 [Cannabis sativa]|uniref:Uncharacterized protein n=1 Tax=Cannabis sativa TaxID=3483 RepID=A0A7J6GRJ0_CANSA|nr:hypothetical protein F8388_010073 [Cannabis sativa]
MATSIFGLGKKNAGKVSCLSSLPSSLELCQEIPPDFTFALVPEYNVDICLYTLLAMLHNAQLLKSVLKRDF